MSQLQRLNIYGIRSFGPEEQDLQKIKFFSPLTLIQGQNGCGKTTIIEALKFGITGELPAGSARGQGFVYDPKLAKVFETRGQIKLRVSDTKGELVTVTKTVVVTRKHNNKMEFKNLDGTIARGKPGGDMQHLSKKCADIDAEMCASLGVSKAILSNVIFCHQEDSNWPLEEGKKLKEKFDEIFDATRYKKCLDLIHKYMKQGTERLKLLKLEVSTLEDTRNYVRFKRDTLEEKETRLQELIENIAKNKTKLNSLQSQLQEVMNTELNFGKLCTKFEIKKKDIQNLIEQQNELRKNINVFTGTDEELAEKINKFEQDLQSLQSDIDALVENKLQIENNENSLQKKINEYQKKLGSLQAEEAQNDLKKESRNKLVQKSIKDFGLTRKVADHSIDNQIQVIISELNETLENKKVNVKLLESTFETEEKECQSSIDKLRVEYAQIKQNIFITKKNINDSKDELKKLQHEIDELNSAGQKLQISDKKIQRFEKDIKYLETSVNTDELREKINSEKKKQKDLEEKLTVVDAEVKILQEFTSLQTEIELKNENLINKQNDLQKLKNKHDKSLNHIFDNSIPKSDLKRGVFNYQNTQNKLIKDLTNQINNKQREMHKLESSLHSKQEKLSEKEKELENYQQELAVYCENKELEEIIQEQHNSVKEMQTSRGIYYSSKYIYQKFIKDFQADSPCCPVCKRNVPEKNYALKVIDGLSKKIENFPNEIQNLDVKLVDANKKYETLITLKPIGEKVKKLNEELPILKVSAENCETDFKKCSDELETLKNDIKKPQDNEKIANSVIGDVTLMDQLQKELINLEQEISSLNLRMPTNESSRGIQEALSDQESFKNDLKSSRNTLESDQNKLSQHIDRLQRLKEEKNILVTEQLALKESLQGKDNLIEKSTELERKIVEMQSQIQDLEKGETIGKNNLEVSIKRKEELQKKNRVKMDETRTNFNTLQKIINAITDFQSEIDNFTKKDITEKMRTINDEIQSTKTKLSEYATKKSKIDSNVEELRSQKSNSKINFRELESNITLRQKQKEQSKLEKELVVLEKQIGDNDISTVRSKKNELLELETRMQEKVHKAEGKKGELKDTITEIKTELATPKNANIIQDYKKKFIEYKLQDRGMSDLKEFVRGMDWAIMQFHRQRMIQINGIIKDLWRTIYKGNDIDYIEIKTDDIQTVGADRRKVYNYRIVQVKNEAELDMRGRCSAGQRVLASLIIRIALSETFSSNCGILTLDEPTTNLDRENIHSLCEALVELIHQKKQQKNFQLIIITHDEDFVDRLTRSESLEQYYVIRRNEFGKSVISVKR